MTARLWRALFRPVLIVVATFAAALASISATVTAAVTLTATALIVPGTGVSDPALVEGYTENAISYYVAPSTNSCGGTCTPEPVTYIAQWWPFPMEGWGGLSGAKFNDSVASGVAHLTSLLVGLDNPSAENPIYIFGYSQGTKVDSVEKSDLKQLTAAEQSHVNFTLLSNLNRPNGGLLERFAFLGTVPIWDVTFGEPTPNNTGMTTTDISFQYDGISDFPQYPINLLAVLNAFAGAMIVHPDLLSPNGRHPDGLPGGLTPAELSAAMADPANREQYGDTTYISIPASILPLLIPVRDFGVKTHTEFLTTPLIDLVQPALRVMIETGYDRAISYGWPTPVGILPQINPITFTKDLAAAIGQGVQAALHDIGIQTPAPGSSVKSASVAAAAPAPVAVPAPGPAAGATASPTAEPATVPVPVSAPVEPAPSVIVSHRGPSPAAALAAAESSAKPAAAATAPDSGTGSTTAITPSRGRHPSTGTADSGGASAGGRHAA